MHNFWDLVRWDAVYLDRGGAKLPERVPSSYARAQDEFVGHDGLPVEARALGCSQNRRLPLLSTE